MRILAAHNPNTTIREQSSSGGVFSMLAEEIIREGGVVYGATFDDSWNVVHKRVDSIDGLAELRGSKYVWSNVGHCYEQALVDLQAGRRVLFSGTPCQIASFRKRIGYNENALLVEVVCHGTSKPELWTRYLNELCSHFQKAESDISSIKFRDKRTGWKEYSFTIEFKDGTEYSKIYYRDPFICSFLYNLSIKEGCFNCKFKQPTGSQADITIGDLWGIENIDATLDNDIGTTLLISNTEIGDTAIKNIIFGKELVFDNVVKYNKAITCAPYRPDDYNSFQEYVSNHTSVTNALLKFTKVPFLKRFWFKVEQIIKKRNTWNN